MAHAAAAGVLLTATGTVGGLAFAAWGALDMGLSHPRAKTLAQRAWHGLARAHSPWAPQFAQLRRSVEGACFDMVGHLQVGPMLLPAHRA